MHPWRLGLLLLSAGCAAGLADQIGFVEPMDGSESVSIETVLRLVDVASHLPPEAELPQDLITVVDRSNGGMVDGQLHRSGSDLEFHPEHPWREDTSYHWHVARQLPEARSAVWSLLEPIPGNALFSTVVQVTPLEVVRTVEGETCVLLSTAVEDPPSLEIWIDGERQIVPWSLRSSVEWTPLPVRDPVSVACTDVLVHPEAIIRLGTAAPLRGIDLERSLRDVLLERHRGVAP